jgi:hypothetical protein
MSTLVCNPTFYHAFLLAIYSSKEKLQIKSAKIKQVNEKIFNSYNLTKI